MRKTFVLLLFFCSLTSGLSQNTQYDSESDFKIELDSNVSGGVMITKYIGSKQEVRIPPRIQNYPVTSIGAWAFFGCTSLTSITIPNSVKSIVDFAFSGCTRLTAINVAAGNNSYTSENGVLYNKNKTTLITYPAGKTSVAFAIPNSVTSIASWAFADCTSLTSVSIPNSVTSIVSYAFRNCTSLTSVTIPDSLTSIEQGAFYGCTSLTSEFRKEIIKKFGEGVFNGSLM